MKIAAKPNLWDLLALPFAIVGLLLLYLAAALGGYYTVHKIYYMFNDHES